MIDKAGKKEIMEMMNPPIEPDDTMTALTRLPGGVDISQPVGSTGLHTDPRRIAKYNINDLERYLVNIDFTKHIPNYYDCEDRAFWGIAHLRHAFPGCPVGVASGYALEGPVASQSDKAHAVIILWYIENDKFNYVFWDPLPGCQLEIKRFNSQIVIAFPMGLNQPSSSDPAPLRTVPVSSRLLPNPQGIPIVIFDDKRMIYKFNTPDEKGLLDYLKKAKYENECVDFSEHTIRDPTAFYEEPNRKWRHYDQALWAFAHVRRSYPGCPVGLAINRHKEPFSALVIWRPQGGVVYWNPDPDPNKRGIINDNDKPELILV